MLGQLAAGVSVDELLADYPYLEREDVFAALEDAAAAAGARARRRSVRSVRLLLDGFEPGCLTLVDL